MATHLITLDPVSLTAGSGTPITSTASSLFASSILLEASSTNNGNVYWGSSNVTATNGSTIVPSAKAQITFDLVYGVNGKIDLSTVYLATDNTGNTVRVNYLQWDGG